MVNDEDLPLGPQMYEMDHICQLLDLMASNPDYTEMEFAVHDGVECLVMRNIYDNGVRWRVPRPVWPGQNMKTVIEKLVSVVTDENRAKFVMEAINERSTEEL